MYRVADVFDRNTDVRIIPAGDIEFLRTSPGFSEVVHKAALGVCRVLGINVVEPALVRPELAGLMIVPKGQAFSLAANWCVCIFTVHLGQ